MYNPREEATAKTFCKQLSMVARPLGMEVSAPTPVKVNGVTPEAFVGSLHNVLRNNGDLKFVVIIFPNLREDRYNAVKRVCCSEIGIPSQVIKLKQYI